MKVIGFNGSARKDGNTAILINHVFEGLKKEGIQIMKTLGENMEEEIISETWAFASTRK